MTADSEDVATSEASVLARLAALDDAEIGEFVDELWRRAGWTVETAASADAPSVATRERRTRSERVLLYAFPANEGRVEADEIREVADEDERVTAVSTVGFTKRAVDVADAHGVDIVGPDAVERLVTALNASDMLSPHP